MQSRSIWHFSKVTFFALDYCLLVIATVCGFALSPSHADQLFTDGAISGNVARVALALSAFLATGLQISGAQRTRAGFPFSETFIQVALGIIGGGVAFVLASWVVAYALVGRYILLFTAIYGTGLVLGSRFLIWEIAARRPRRLVVYGSLEDRNLIEKDIRQTGIPLEIVANTTVDPVTMIPVMDSTEVAPTTLRDYCIRLDANEVLIASRAAIGTVERSALMQCTQSGISVLQQNSFSELYFERVNCAGLTESWFWDHVNAHSHPIYLLFKRAIDVGLSLVGLCLISPLLPVVALVIKLQDRGPLFYSQIRTGVNDRPFRIFKVRTMRTDAESGGAQWAAARDKRVTFFGNLLRRTRLDEVPQFWNILKGDMSFIGPRPERPELITQIESAVPYYRYRHLIKPGLTGWAQINYPYGASIEDAQQKLSFDLYYLKHASAFLDILIILRTIRAALNGAR